MTGALRPLASHPRKGRKPRSAAETTENVPQTPANGEGSETCATGLKSPAIRHILGCALAGFTRERSLVRAQPCPSPKVLLPGYFSSRSARPRDRSELQRNYIAARSEPSTWLSCSTRWRYLDVSELGSGFGSVFATQSWSRTMPSCGGGSSSGIL
jgi:hypothetical protein